MGIYTFTFMLGVTTERISKQLECGLQGIEQVSVAATVNTKNKNKKPM